MTTAVTRLKLNSICAGTTNFLVVGIIIAKQNPKVIKSKNDNKEISVYSFTVRDSPRDVVNVTVWGSYNFIKQLYRNFKIGDTVDLINSTVKIKSETEEKYMPKSTSSFFLTLNENSSQMLIHDTGDSSTNYKRLLRIPTCPQYMYLKIEDIHSSGKEMCGKFCSLLVVVRCIKPTKSIKTKNGKETFLKEIIVLDKTHPTLFVKIWNDELIERTTRWIPRKTVLNISDLYLKWDIFNKNMTAAISNRTIITEDPITNEANDLKNFTNTHLIELSDKFIINVPDLSTITEIMTCKRILLNTKERNLQFSAVLYAIVSKFNIDGSSPLFLNKCNLCGAEVENTHFMCLNPECNAHFNMENRTNELESIINIKLSLTDISGTLDNCILHHKAASKMFIEVENFQNMSLEQRTELKWKYLFINCEIKLICTKTNPGEKITITIVDICTEGPIRNFISRIPIY